MPTVLLIDDNPAALEILCRVLHQSGFDVAFAATGEEGIGIVRERTIDFVVANYCLVDMSGLQVLYQLRSRVPQAPFVIVIDFVATAAAIEEEAGRKSIGHPQAGHAISAIEKRFAEADLSVRSVAHDIGVSTEHLCRLLKRETGQTFVTLLRHKRVRAASQLLSTTTLSMKEIADRAGWGNASQFARDFKRLRGVAPSRYRSQIESRPSLGRVGINLGQAISTNRKG